MSANQAITIADQWATLVSAALLGTDRRPAPPAPPGPLATVCAGIDDDDDAVATLHQIAAITAMRRGGVQPSAPLPRLVPAPHDPRPECTAAAVERLHDLLVQWPQLVDEWLALLERSGRRLPPDAAVDLLGRWRNDPRRRVAVERAAGAVTTWLTELFPDQLGPGPASRSRAGDPRPADAGPGVPLPADIAALLQLDTVALGAALAGGLERGELGVRHRPALVQLLVELPAERLADLPGTLERAGTNPTTMGLALMLADLARTRLAMIEELTP